MTIYTVATTKPPTIVCPPWCDISDVHLGDLTALEGFCTHLGSVWIGERGELRVGNCCTPAGELDPTPRNRPTIHLGNMPSELYFDEAEDMALTLLAFIKSEREAGR